MMAPNPCALNTGTLDIASDAKPCPRSPRMMEQFLHTTVLMYKLDIPSLLTLLMTEWFVSDFTMGSICWHSKFNWLGIFPLSTMSHITSYHDPNPPLSILYMNGPHAVRPFGFIFLINRSPALISFFFCSRELLLTGFPPSFVLHVSEKVTVLSPVVAVFSVVAGGMLVSGPRTTSAQDPVSYTHLTLPTKA